MASPILISNPPPGFSVLAIIRGFQLAILGAYRSLQNPSLFNLRYYRQALFAIIASLAIQFIIWSPILLVRFVIKLISVFVRPDRLNDLALGLKHIQFNVLNIGVFMVSASRFFNPQLDQLFLESLEFIDQVRVAKHPATKDKPFYLNLVSLATEEQITFKRPTLAGIRSKWLSSQEFAAFMLRHISRGAFSIAIFFIGKIPMIGSFVLGAISFQNLNNKIGTVNAAVIFCFLQIIPKQYAILFLTTYWGSRNMIHDLLMPYYSRVKFTKSDKEQWTRTREGILFGFGLCFFIIIHKLSWCGLLIYGFAESSAAYLITKVTDPPPSHPAHLLKWSSTQLMWSKEKEHRLLSGKAIEKDEGFLPIPGSFLFSK